MVDEDLAAVPRRSSASRGRGSPKRVAALLAGPAQAATVVGKVGKAVAKKVAKT